MSASAVLGGKVAGDAPTRGARRGGFASFPPAFEPCHPPFLSGPHPSLAVSVSFSVQALADLLDVRYRGYFVYPRPDKNALEGQLGGGDLVRTRITELERYLSHLVTHPVIGPSEVRGLRGLRGWGRLFGAAEEAGGSGLSRGGRPTGGSA